MYVVHMVTYTSETVTTRTRRYLLPLPANTAELGKLESAMWSQWAIDHPSEKPWDNSVTVTAEDDLLVFSWKVPGEGLVKPWSSESTVHMACGHEWEMHTEIGCAAVVGVGQGNNYCPCEEPKP